MENPIENVIEKIKEDHIVPESRLKLHWRSYLFWAIWGATMILGALFFSLIILNFLDIRLRILQYFGFGRFMFIIMRSAPFLWIALSILALFSGLLAFRKTKRGYRYSMLFVTSLGVLIVSILGITLHMANIDDQIGVGIYRQMPGYRNLAFPIEGRWSHPDEKMLGGEVLYVKEEQILIVSFEDKIWEVHYSPDTEIRIRKGKLESGINIGILGERIGVNKFKAEFIHSIPPRGIPINMKNIRNYEEVGL